MPSFERTKGRAISVVSIFSVARRIKLPAGVAGANGRPQRRDTLRTAGNVVDLMEALRRSVGRRPPSVAVEQFAEEASYMPALSMAGATLALYPRAHTSSSGGARRPYFTGLLEAI
jgi:hypothetical protein